MSGIIVLMSTMSIRSQHSGLARQQRQQQQQLAFILCALVPGDGLKGGAMPACICASLQPDLSIIYVPCQLSLGWREGASGERVVHLHVNMESVYVGSPAVLVACSGL